MLPLSNPQDDQIFEFADEKRVHLTNWDDNVQIPSVLPFSLYDDSNPFHVISDPERSILRIRSCRIFLSAYRFVNCQHVSYSLNKIFNECGVMCSFDIQSNITLLKRIVVKNEYDIIFLSREILADHDFQSQLLGSPNRDTPIIVYKKSLKKQSSPSK